MRPNHIVRRGPAILASLFLLTASGGELHAQQEAGTGAPRRDFDSGFRAGVGYAAVMPGAMLGAGAWHLFSQGRFGLFAEVKMSYPDITKHKDYCPGVVQPCNVPHIEQNRVEIRLRDEDQFRIVNAGIGVRAGPEIVLLAGLGSVRRSTFREYVDVANEPGFQITDGGAYWAPFDPASKMEVQAVVGVLLRLGNHLVARFGYETAPGGLSLGGYWVISH